MFYVKFTKLTVLQNYGQYLAHTKDIKNTIINIAKANTIYVKFNICSISSKGSISVQTVIKHTEFHNIKANTLVLLCFIDIDWLGVYFNHINNLLVMKNTYIFVNHCFDHLFLL